MGTPRRTSRALAWFAIGAWVLWLLNLASMARYYWVRADHPSYVPVLGSLTLLALVGLVLLLTVVARLFRGPNRSRALGWLLVGITPILLAATHLSMVAWILFHDRTQLSTPVKWGSSAAASVADLVGRYRLPAETSGERVLLFHSESDEARRELPQLDEHVVRMEKLLGQPPGGTAHLFRGPVFSTNQVPAWYLCGVAVVEDPRTNVADLDRHELAHAIIDQYCDTSAHPPSLLIEGWAESQAGYDPGFLAKRAWERRAHGFRLTLAALTGSTWYDIADRANYEFGGPLVDYVLRTHGGPKFLELYTSCRPESFAADVERVLGVTLDELDARYWEDIAQQISDAPTDLDELLADATLSEEVDRALWQKFVQEFGQVARQPAAEAVPTIVEHELSHTGKHVGTEPKVEHSEIIHAGDRHRWLYGVGGKEQVILATPEASCEIAKPAGTANWSIADWKNGIRKPSDYWNNLAWIQIVNWSSSGDLNDYRMQLFSEANNGRNRTSRRITRFEYDPKKMEGTAVLEFEFGSTKGDGIEVSARFEMYPQRRWAIASYEVKRVHTENTTEATATFSYPVDNEKTARPVQVDYRFKGRDGESTTQARLLRYEPWTVDEAAFEPESWGIAQSDIDARYRAPWYFWCWGAMAPVTLLAGVGLLVGSRNATPAVNTAGDSAATDSLSS